MKKLLAFIIPILLAIGFVQAQYYVVYNNTDGITFSAAGSPSEQTSNSIIRKTGHASQMPLFFDKPFNQTYIELLGGTTVLINFTFAPARDNTACAGGCSTFQQGSISPVTGELDRIGFTDNGADDVEVDLGDAALEVIYANWNPVEHNLSFLNNYTNGTIDLYWEYTGGSGNVYRVASITTNDPYINLSILISGTGTDPTGLGGTLNNVNIYADLDADYFNSGQLYTISPQNNSYFADEEQVNINFTAPIMVNASYTLNGVTTSLCENCLFGEVNVTGATGSNDLIINYTFTRGEEVFNNSEVFSVSAGTDFQYCVGAPADYVTYMTVNFADEDTSVAVASNFTLFLKQGSSNVFNYTHTGTGLSTFSVCSQNQTENIFADLDLTYNSNTYAIRELNTQNMTLNSTNPLAFSAWHVLTSEASNVVVTLQDNIGNPLANYLIEVYKLSGLVATERLVASYISAQDTGQAVFPLDIGEIGTSYRFIVYRNGELIKDFGYAPQTTTSRTLTLTAETLRIAHNQEQFRALLNYTFTLQDKGFPDNFTVFWFDADSLITQGCLKVQGSNLTSAFTNETCVTGGTNNITIWLPFPNMTYSGDFYVVSANDGFKYLIDSIVAEFTEFAPFRKLGLDAVFWVFLLIVFGAMALKGIPTGMVLLPVVLFDLAIWFKIIDLPIGWLWTTLLAGLILAWLLEKN